MKILSDVAIDKSLIIVYAFIHNRMLYWTVGVQYKKREDNTGREKTMERKHVSALFISILLLSVSISLGQVTNGFFDDGLNGWDQSGLVNDEGGYAQLYPESIPDLAGQDWTPSVLNSVISQSDILIDEYTESLSFSFLPLMDDIEGDPETDWFRVYFNSDLIYEWSSSEVENIGIGVTVIPPDETIENGWTTVILSIDSALWNTLATIEFNLENGTDLWWDETEGLLIDWDPVTTISIDDVQLNIAPAVVPAPAALGLALIGCSCAGLFRRRK